MFLESFCRLLDGMYDLSDEAKSSLWVSTVGGHSPFYMMKNNYGTQRQELHPKSMKKNIKHLSVRFLSIVIKNIQWFPEFFP